MLELAFGDNGGGALQFAKGVKGSCQSGVRITFDENGKTVKEEPFGPEIYDGPELKGSSQDVVGLPLALDMGHIADLEAGRLALWERLFAERISELGTAWADLPEQPAPADWAREQLKALREGIPRLLQAANGEGIRIWYSESPGDLCGLCWAMYLLRDATGPVVAVRLPALAQRLEGEYQRLQGVGDCAPEMLPAIAEECGRVVPPAERAAWAARWEQLVREDGVLRAVVNGVPQTVPEDFYDFVLYANLPETVCRICDLIVGCLLNGPCGVGDLWYAARIRHMLTTGVLQLVRKDENRFYYCEVRRFPTVL